MHEREYMAGTRGTMAVDWEELPGPGAFDAVDCLDAHVPVEGVESPHGRSQMLP